MKSLRFAIPILALLCYSCGTSKLKKQIDHTINLKAFQNQFTGLLVVDAETSDTIYSLNSNKFFTPASNTKILTLYAALKYLGDSIPAFKYHISNDTVAIIGTGDPSFLHPFFKDSTFLRFIEGFNYLKLYEQNLKDEKYGPGWAWEDYDTYFSPERSSFPMYGNVLRIFERNGIKTIPSFLNTRVYRKNSNFRRDYNANNFYIDSQIRDTIEVPIVMDFETKNTILDSLLTMKHAFYNGIPEGELSIKYSIPTDSLYKRMMLVSDNFLAEQLLILCSTIDDSELDTNRIRASILSNDLKDLRQKPKWVDGSGLSRYNLFTPESFVHILNLMLKNISKERLFNIFPFGGSSGTLKNWYKDEKPYVFAKSGSVGNNYCISGYLITDSKRTLIFSFMTNHFTIPTSHVKKEIQTVLKLLRDSYK